MKKTIHLLNVDNFFPEMWELTLPRIQAYASRIGADVQIISERKNPDFPPTYEKTQIYELGKDSDWNILIDADVIVSPTAPDLTNLPWSRPDTVLFGSNFQASQWFAADQYFLRDGRNIGIASSMMVVPFTCHDFWTPLEFGYDVASTRTRRQHILDEYCFSRNLARYGLKFNGIGNDEHFVHIGTCADGVYGTENDETREQKVERAKRVIEEMDGNFVKIE